MRKLLLLASALLVSFSGLYAADKYERSFGGGFKELNTVSHRSAPENVRRAVSLKDAPADYIEVPFVHSLGKNESEISGKYIVIDANGDGRSWKVNGMTSYCVCMKPNADGVDSCDDWLVSPAVRLEGGKVYTVSFEHSTSLNSGTEEKLELLAGLEPTVEALTVSVVPEFTFTGKTFVVKSVDFTAPADGYYYFGFHVTSAEATSGNPRICNFSIAENPDAVPAPENAVEVPFKHSLGKGEADVTNLYTWIDGNDDGRGWKIGGFTGYSVCMKPNADGIDACDDWMVSLPVHLFAGKNYRLSIDESATLTSGTEEKMEVLAGKAPEADALTMEIIPLHTFTGKDWVTREQDFTVAADGYYYFGFHVVSETAKSGNVRICDFSIAEATEKIDPPVAGTLSYKLAPKGELKATVTYVAPTMSQGGNALAGISRVEVRTNWLLSHTFTEVAPGDSIVFETTLYNNGYNRIEATAYVGDEPGESALITDFYAGYDNPMPVANPVITLSDDYRKVTVSWDPVSEVGESGGYVDVSEVVYYIFDAFGSYYDPALAVTAETSYTFDYSEMEGQDFVAFQITAGVGENFYSLETNTDIVIVGEPDQLPWGESFSDAYYSQMWAIDPESTTSTVYCGTIYDNELQTNAEDYDAEPEYLNSRDGDNGFFYMMPMEKDAVYGFFSTKIDISAAANPVLEFYYQGKGSALDAMVAAAGGKFEVVKSVDLKETPTDDWTLCRVDLTPYKSQPYIQIELRLRAIHNDDEYIWSVPLDDIRVRDLVNCDLRVMSVVAPVDVKAGDGVSLQCGIENLGTEICNGAVVELHRNGAKVQELVLEAIAPDSVAFVKFTEPTSVVDHAGLAFELKAVAAGDANSDNDAVEKNVAVKVPDYPAVSGLTAVPVDGGVVSLGWDAPDYSSLIVPQSVTEDFESPDYQPLTIEGFAGWQFYDGDRRDTYTFLKDSKNPYRTRPMAFQLYDPVVAGVPDDYLIDIPPHSGNRLLVAWSCDRLNDNWLISPELSGEAQTVSFFARSFSVAYPEEFEVLYSTSGTDIDSFVKIDEVVNYPANGIVSEDWTEYSVALPEGALHFAIRHMAYDTYALFVDDITYQTAPAVPADLAVDGYNIYRDGVKVNEKPVSGVAFDDTLEENGDYDYCVSVVYNHGESRPCDNVSVTVVNAGVDSVVAGGISISVSGSDIVIAGAEGETFAVSAVDGRIVRSGVAADLTKVSVAAGVYVVRAGDSVAKVVVNN